METDYGLDEEGVIQAVLEYRDVAGTVLGLIERGKPLATASNACVWSFVVSPGFICEGRVAPLRFLPKLARWYISIEDGECSVERDLAVVRDVSDTTRTDDLGIIADTVVGRSGAPCVEERSGGPSRWRAYEHVKGVGKVLADVPRRPSRVRFEERHCGCFSGIKEETNVAEISEGHIGSSRWRCVHGKANRGSICCDCDMLRRPSRILEEH